MNQFKPVQQSRQQALRAYCPNLYTLFIHTSCIAIVFNRRCESQNGSIPEKVNLNGHKEEKKIDIFSCYNDSTRTLHYYATKLYEIDVENFLPILN